MLCWIHDFCSDKQQPPWFIQPFPGQDFTILQYVGRVLFTFHCLWVSQGEIHRKRLAWKELKATFDWQSPSYMWDQHWRHDSLLGRKSQSGKGQSIHQHRKIALLRKTFHCTSCSSTCSYRGSSEKGRLFAVSWRSLLMFWSGPMSEWRNWSRI